MFWCCPHRIALFDKFWKWNQQTLRYLRAVQEYMYILAIRKNEFVEQTWRNYSLAKRNSTLWHLKNTSQSISSLTKSMHKKNSVMLNEIFLAFCPQKVHRNWVRLAQLMFILSTVQMLIERQLQCRPTLLCFQRIGFFFT